MNKLDSKPLSLKCPDAPQADVSTFRRSPGSPGNVSRSTGPETARRLIVLIPDGVDYHAVAHRVWELANASGARVRFLGLCHDAADEPSLRRQLVTLSALMGDGKVPTEVKVEIGTNWVNLLKRNYQTGDVIVCFAEQRAGLLHRPLSQVLQTNLNVPVYIFPGPSPQTLSRSNWLSQIMAWTGSIGIIAGFFLLQIRIASLPQDWAQTTLLILSMIGEVWLIWGWNSLFS